MASSMDKILTSTLGSKYGNIMLYFFLYYGLGLDFHKCTMHERNTKVGQVTF
jgi:hypothetical protein